MQYGEDVQMHEATDNTSKTRTVGTITLRLTGNAQGSFYHYSLMAGRRLTRGRCTPLLMPSSVIDRVHDMATKQKCPNGIIFLHNDNISIASAPEDTNTADDNTVGSEGVDSDGDDDGNHRKVGLNGSH